MSVEPSLTTPDDLEDAVAVFVHHRKRLFGIAYRILGSTVEAEDVVQEVWLRWHKTDRSVVLSPAAFLSSATTRLAINVAQSARMRRETYIGPWLPEPVDTGADPEVGAERAEAVEMALLLVLEKLTPVERAAYVLREAFDYAYAEIADMLEVSLVNVRKIVSRARRHLLDERRETVDAAEHRRFLGAFVSAARTGDVASLEALLAPDVVSLSDGNGMRGCARVHVQGRARVARLAIQADPAHGLRQPGPGDGDLPTRCVGQPVPPVIGLVDDAFCRARVAQHPVSDIEQEPTLLPQLVDRHRIALVHRTSSLSLAPAPHAAGATAPPVRPGTPGSCDTGSSRPCVTHARAARSYRTATHFFSRDY
jgi:RNA polymerase sigma-70 factor (ECF subfamily)